MIAIMDKAEYKKCAVCKVEKLLSDFAPHRSTRDKFEATCKACKNISAKLWRTNNPDRARSNDLKKKYGITLEQKLSLLASQGNKCAACGATEHDGKYPGIHGWHIDHDHETDVIRGILCSRCNLTLGNAQENIERLASLILYLRKHGK